MPNNYELTLTPAYGRDYKTAEQVQAAWSGGKDFKVATVVSPDCGRYTSIRDAKEFPGQHCKIRYNQLADFVLYNLKTGEFSVCDEENL